MKNTTEEKNEEGREECEECGLGLLDFGTRRLYIPRLSMIVQLRAIYQYLFMMIFKNALLC